MHSAASDPVDGIHPFNIPIPPYKHPPAREDFRNIRRRRKERDNDTPASHDDSAPREQGRVDDYA